ncbi:MAG: sugar ABC transporter permease [Planctomycetota bacterium]|nr:MAG: sugar ABC transporter permease [Planctomycetota bacterium]
MSALARASSASGAPSSARRALPRGLADLARGLAFLAPNFLGFLLFTAVPVVAIFAVAFTRGDYTTGVDPESGRFFIDAQWAGVHWFRVLWADPRFWQSLWNTLFLMLSVPIQMALALGLALLLNQRVPGRTAWRALLFLPTVAAGLALYMVWRQIYNQDHGLLNGFLAALGIVAPGEGPDWLGDPALAKPALLVMLVWIAMGGTNMVLYLAALQDVPRSLYEAAAIDGAGTWDRFRHITWPALRPTTFFILTTNLIGGVQIFDQVLVMTGGGPEGATTTLLYLIYQNVYEYEGKLGYAAALSVVLFGLVLAATFATWLGNRGAREAP